MPVTRHRSQLQVDGHRRGVARKRTLRFLRAEMTGDLGETILDVRTASLC